MSLPFYLFYGFHCNDNSVLCLWYSDGDIQYAVAREMDPEMEDAYEKFVAENEAHWLTNHTSSSWLPTFAVIVFCDKWRLTVHDA